MQSNELIKQHKLETIARVYQKVQHDVGVAFSMLEESQKELQAILPTVSYPDLWQGTITSRYFESDVPKSKEHIKRQVWRHLFTVSNVKEFMSIKKREELDHLLFDEQKDKLPEPTIENILSTFAEYMNNSTDIIKEAIKEVFDWLRPPSWDSYKTNKKHLIGERVIKQYAVDASFGFRLNYSIEKKLKALENAFTLLDGKGVIHYPNDIITKLNEAMNGDRDTFSNEYFEFKWYKNGNLHIKFLRRDLLDKLNEIGGDGSLTENQ